MPEQDRELYIANLRAQLDSAAAGLTSPPDRMLQFFQYSHLPPSLAEVSKPFCDLANHICATLPSNPERTVALRKLLEAKDCAVRAVLYKEPQQ